MSAGFCEWQNPIPKTKCFIVYIYIVIPRGIEIKASDADPYRVTFKIGGS